QWTGQVGPERHLDGQPAVVMIAAGQGVPGEAQPAADLAVRLRLVERAFLGVGSADAEDALVTAELADPADVAAVVAAAGVAEAAGVRVHDAEDDQPAVLLAEQPARGRLGVAVEADVRQA